MTHFIHPTFWMPGDGVMIAHAHINLAASPPNTHKALQSKAVRQLLKAVMARYGMAGRFDDSSFPYRILGEEARFVSFSHSMDQMALIIANTPCAIDLEIRPISHRIALRHFHANEIQKLHSQDGSARSLLWRLKECHIKLHQGKLFAGMGEDFSSVLTAIDGATALIHHNDHHIYNHSALKLTAMF